MPKFLCVKGILFFSFWQGIFISILVAAKVITKLGPYTDSEHISLALTDALVCLEMPLFAIAHQYAFSTVDYVDKHAKYVARMPMLHAFKDAFGLRDVIEDVKATLRGEGMDYRAFEPSEGFIHQGAGRDRRIRAGLRYSQGGKRKYWLPQPTTSSQPPGKFERRVNKIVERVTGRPDQGEEVYAPLLQNQEDDVVHLAADLQPPSTVEENIFGLSDSAVEGDGFDLPFGDPDPADEALFDQSRKYLFGDYNYPVVDVSNEDARMRIWVEEERILRDERGVWVSPILGPNRRGGGGYGATESTSRNVKEDGRGGDSESDGSAGKGKGKVREVVIDKEHDRHTDRVNGDVRLGWTKLGKGSGRGGGAAAPTPIRPPQLGRIRTLSSQGVARSASGSPASGSTPSTPRKDTDSPRPILPPDAVDLVVEDTEAGHEDTAHDRRKGEPAGLRKVYRRGYVVEEEDESEDASGTQIRKGEVEVEREGEGQEDVKEAEEEIEEVEDAVAHVEEEMASTVVTTPPVHARVVVDHPHGLEDNPWA